MAIIFGGRAVVLDRDGDDVRAWPGSLSYAENGTPAGFVHGLPAAGGVDDPECRGWSKSWRCMGRRPALCRQRGRVAGGFDVVGRRRWVARLLRSLGQGRSRFAGIKPGQMAYGEGHLPEGNHT